VTGRLLDLWSCFSDVVSSRIFLLCDFGTGARNRRIPPGPLSRSTNRVFPGRTRRCLFVTVRDLRLSPLQNGIVRAASRKSQFPNCRSSTWLRWNRTTMSTAPRSFTQLRSAIIRTMSPVIATARATCLGGSKIAPSTIRLRLTIQSNPNSGAEVASVREVIGFAGVPLRERTLTCILDQLKKHPFPVPITSVPRSDLVTFAGETFVRAHL
jgi:hypothetical protein